MFDYDLFKTKKAWTQWSFWVALAPVLTLVVGYAHPPLIDWWQAHKVEIGTAFAPFMLWLTMNGLVRKEGVKQAGEVASTIQPELERQKVLYPELINTPLESNPPTPQPDTPLDPDEVDAYDDEEEFDYTGESS